MRIPTSRGLAGLLLVLALSGCDEGSSSSAPPAPPDGGGPPTGLPESTDLLIPPIVQQTSVWCWAASTQMVFRHYGMPNLNPGGDYQCGVVGAYYYLRFGPSHPCASVNCYLCTNTIANLSEVRFLVNGYGNAAFDAGVVSADLSSTELFGPLTFAALQTELAENRPVLAGVNLQPTISLPGISKHLVTLTGYDNSGSQQIVLVNDPFPYFLEGIQPSPYELAGGTQVTPGKYAIRYADLVNLMDWDNTLYQIEP